MRRPADHLTCSLDLDLCVFMWAMKEIFRAKVNGPLWIDSLFRVTASKSDSKLSWKWIEVGINPSLPRRMNHWIFIVLYLPVYWYKMADYHLRIEGKSSWAPQMRKKVSGWPVLDCQPGSWWLNGSPSNVVPNLCGLLICWEERDLVKLYLLLLSTSNLSSSLSFDWKGLSTHSVDVVDT